MFSNKFSHLLAVVVATSLLLSLCACDKNFSDGAATSASSTTAETEVSSSEMQVETVSNGSEIVGEDTAPDPLESNDNVTTSPVIDLPKVEFD